MTIIAGPNIGPTGNGLIYLLDPGNQKCYSSTENLYPTSETLNAGGYSFINKAPSPYYQVNSGGPYGGVYFVTTVTTYSGNYWFEWGNTVSLNAGDTVTQTWHVRPYVTATNTMTQIQLQLWTGAGRAWTTTRLVTFNLGSNPSVSGYSYSTSQTGVISLLDNGWYRISQTATADQSGYSGMSLFVGSLSTTGTTYHFAAAQIERNPTFTGYTPTYGTAKGRSLTLNDISGNYSSSTFVNATPLYVPSNGGYLSFGNASTATSTSSYITTPIRGDTLFTSSSSFTVSAWFNPSTYVVTTAGWITGCIVGCFYYEGYGIGWYPSGSTSTLQIQTQMRTRGGYVYGPGITYNLPLNTWNHCVMTYSYPKGISYLYVNGVAQGNFAVPAAWNTGVYTNIVGLPVNIASPQAPGGPNATYLPGSIGPVMIYNRDISQDEVTQLFNAHRGRFGV